MSAYNVNKKSLRFLFGLFFITLFLYIFKSSYISTPNASLKVHQDTQPYQDVQVSIDKSSIETVQQKKMAFVTFLCDDVMGEATEVLVYSLKQTKTKHDIVVLVLDEVSTEVRTRLEYLGAKIISVDHVKYPWNSSSARRKGFNKACRYSKLNLWNLTQYKKVVFLDADTMVVRPIDELFKYQQFTAAVDIGGVLNTGVFVAEPNEETYKDIMATYENAPSYNKGDQGFLNYYFNQTSHALPGNYNLMIKFTHFSTLALGFVTKNTVKVLHFTSETKPWNFHFLHQREWRENYDGYLFGLWTRAKRQMLNSLEKGGLYTSQPEWDNKQRVQYVCDKSLGRTYGRKYPKTEQFSVLLQLTRNSINRKYLEHILKLYASSKKTSQIILNRQSIKDENGKRIQLNNAYFKKLRIKKPVKTVSVKDFDSANNKFNPVKLVKTNSVFLVDDQTVMSVKDLEFGYSVWKKHMDSIVGFKSDAHSKLNSFIENMDGQNKYSMIRSSSGMFLKSDYLYGYTCLLPEQVHYYIDKNPECLDIAMNMMVSGMTAAPPLLVNTNSLAQLGSSSDQTILETKSQCIKDLTVHFNKKNPLILNDEIIAHTTKHDIQSSAFSWSNWTQSV